MQAMPVYFGQQAAPACACCRESSLHAALHAKHMQMSVRSADHEGLGLILLI